MFDSSPSRRQALGLAMTIVLNLGAVALRAEQASQATQPVADELSIEGIVVTPLGMGVPGATVRIELPDAAPGDPPLAETVTSNRGQIAVKLKRPASDQLRFRIAFEGLSEHVGTIDISDPDEPPFIDVTMKGGASIAGTITAAADARPIAGAKIQCENGGRRSVVNSDRDGKYMFDSVYPGSARLTVMATGFGTRREEMQAGEEQVTVDFALRPERRVVLRMVTDSNEPARDVLVEAMADPLQIYSSARSDEKGIVNLPGIDADMTGLNIRYNGEPYLVMRGFEERIELPPSEAGDEGAAASRPAPIEEQFTVTLAGRIGGKVTDKQTGKPIHNVRVLAGREPRYGMPMDWSGPAGIYELTGVQPGSVVVTFQHDDYLTSFQTVDLEAGKTSTVDVALEQGSKLSGTVVDDEGLPVPQVRIAADEWGDYLTLGLRAVTDAKGRFDFPHVPEGEIEFTFVLPGYGKPIKETLASGKSDHVVKLASTAVPLATGEAPAEETKLKPGQAIADLVMTSTDGTTYKLSGLRGKYVFLDCWATWCRPCMAELPNVKALYQATKDRSDFVLIGISLDTDAKALEKARGENGIAWPQVFGPKSGASEAFEELDGVGIPYTCLIGPDGKLLAQHLRGSGLVDEVRKYLSSGTGSGTRPAK